MLLPSLTQSQQDALLLDEFILQTAEALNHLAATMGRCNASFWNLPDERLAAVLNTDPDRTVAVFAANSILGTQVNSMLDTLALPHRISVRIRLVDWIHSRYTLTVSLSILRVCSRELLRFLPIAHGIQFLRRSEVDHLLPRYLYCASNLF